MYHELQSRPLFSLQRSERKNCYHNNSLTIAATLQNPPWPVKVLTTYTLMRNLFCPTMWTLIYIFYVVHSCHGRGYPWTLQRCMAHFFASIRLATPRVFHAALYFAAGEKQYAAPFSPTAKYSKGFSFQLL